jgi:excisionase family DNA binding protein
MTEEATLINDQRFPNGATHRRKLLTLKQVAELLNVNERHVRRLVFERRVPYFKWGHLLRFDPAELEQWLEQARIAADVHSPPVRGGDRRSA